MAPPVIHSGAFWSGTTLFLRVTFDAPLTWEEANAHADLIESGHSDWHLATFSGGAPVFSPQVLDYGSPWIGLFQSETGPEPDGGWQWVTGEPLDYTNWSFGEPNDWDGVEDHGQMYPDGTWNDMDPPLNIPSSALYELSTTRGVDLPGWDGRDLLRGTDLGDTLRGAKGPDEIFGGDGDDVLHGGRWRDALYAGDGADTLIGGRHSDSLSGGDGGDRLRGGHGDDALYGEAGMDTLKGGRGDDVLFGGPDADIFRFDSLSFGADTIYGFEPEDGDTATFRRGQPGWFDVNSDGVIDLRDMGTGTLEFAPNSIRLVFGEDASVTFRNLTEIDTDALIFA